LSSTQFSTISSAGSNVPEGQEKYNNTELMYGATFYSCHTALDTRCCEVKKAGKRVTAVDKFGTKTTKPIP
jgi:hypothetical protein